MPDERDFRPTDADYPHALRALDAPPDPLWVRGAFPRALGVAIVGTRAASPDGARFAGDLAAELTRAGVVVWSGGAEGIDAAAHRGALDAGGATIVVAATGLDRVYPPSHAELFDEVVAAGGAIVSPFAREQCASRATFFHRNAVLAALASTLVVVEAGPKSGARNAAACARRLGKTYWAVTSAPWDAARLGNRIEIELGARPLTSLKPLFVALGLPPPVAEPRARRERRGARARQARGELLADPSATLPDDLDPASRALAAACGATPRHVDDLCAISGLEASVVLPALLTLTLRAVLVEGPAGWFRRPTD